MPLVPRFVSNWFGATRRSEKVADIGEFERVFQRERALSERGARHFSLVVFEPASSALRAELRLTRAIAGRLRDSDVLGRIDKRRYAVILSATDAEGAWVFTDRLLGDLAREYLPADVRVYSDQEDEVLEGARVAANEDAVGARTSAALPLEAAEELAKLAAALPLEAAEELAKLAAVPAPLPSNGQATPFDLAAVRSEFERDVHDLEALFTRRTPPAKRTLDVLGSAALLVALAPVLATIAVAVKFSSPGPILFRQKRAGVGGRPFTFFKFRSMYIDAEARKKELAALNEADGPVFKMKNDPRVTPIGRFIRRYSLDELPQLWNVLKGDMSLVGPRPPTLDEVPAYARWHRRRLLQKGGLTCHWQVSGRSDVSFEEWMRMDARYSREANLGTDIKLLAQTAKAVFTGKGAY
jgi:lipopolysaccharide/colanic/teichoic acid biosynthesis glycosyltransferase